MYGSLKYQVYPVFFSIAIGVTTEKLHAQSATILSCRKDLVIFIHYKFVSQNLSSEIKCSFWLGHIFLWAIFVAGGRSFFILQQALGQEQYDNNNNDEEIRSNVNIVNEKVQFSKCSSTEVASRKMLRLNASSESIE